MKNHDYIVTENNSGSISLWVFNNNGEPCYAYHGCEFDSPGQLLHDIGELNDGADCYDWNYCADNMVEDWEETESYLYSNDNQHVKVIADNNGVYVANMGVNGKIAFCIQPSGERP